MTLNTSRWERLTPKRTALMSLSASATAADIKAVTIRLERDGVEVRGAMPRDKGGAVLRVSGPVAALNRYDRELARGNSPLLPWVQAITVGRLPGDPGRGEVPPRHEPIPVFAAPERLHMRTITSSFDASTDVDALVGQLSDKKLNLTQVYIDRRSGALIGVIDLAGPAWQVLDLESAVLDRGWFRELHPRIQVSTSPFPRGDLTEAETVRFYGQHSEPGVYHKLRTALRDVVVTMSVHLREVYPVEAQEDRPWLGEAHFIFKPGTRPADGLRRVREALESAQLTYVLGFDRATWAPVMERRSGS